MIVGKVIPIEPRLTKRFDQSAQIWWWIVEYGDCKGEANSPEKAMEEFVRQWTHGGNRPQQ